jgi:hypothetical protein
MEKARMRHLLSSLRIHFPHDASASPNAAHQPINRFQEKSANVLLDYSGLLMRRLHRSRFDSFGQAHPQLLVVSQKHHIRGDTR